MRIPMPYFLTNEEWYTYDSQTRLYTLTDKATDEAIKSFEEFYETLSKITKKKMH